MYAIRSYYDLDENDYFEIPVVISNSVNDLASVTTEIHYDPSLIDITDIVITSYSIHYTKLYEYVLKLYLALGT